jgi:hypothetical protein
MDSLSRAYYEVAFERDFLKKKGKAFQDFFSEIMEKRYPRDFQRVRPWGNVGDEKNDGYLKSQRTLFAVYAPNEMKAADTITKVEEDFQGALLHWKDYFDTWVFVHNSRDGLGPEVLKKLLNLEAANPNIKVMHWGFEELRQEVFKLSDIDIASLLGPAPSSNDVHNLSFEDLQVVLLTIARQQPSDELDLRPVPKAKLSANKLSHNVEILLKAGMRKASLVEQFFRQWPDPAFGDEVAEAFRRKYSELKKLNVPSDIIFMKLQEFAGGGRRGTPEHEAAVLAVLAHLFEKCDIFERPLEGVVS